MLTYEDCVELSGLTNEEIEAIAEHEHCLLYTSPSPRDRG